MTDAILARPRNEMAILPPTRTILASLFSFEALVVLYMFAGFYKGDPRFAWIPVDATGLFFALSVVAGSFILVFNPIYKKGLPLVFAMVCLVTWFLVSLMWSPSRIYGPTKVFYMVTLELWGVIAGALIIAPDRKRVRRLFILILLLAIWMGCEAILAYVKEGSTAIAVGSANYLMLGKVCGLGAVVAVVAWLHNRDRLIGWLSLALFFGFGFVLAIAGARGPMLGAALALLVPIGLGIRMTTRRIFYSRALLSVLVLLLALTGGLAAYSTLTGHELGTFERFERLFTGVAEGELRMSEGARAEHIRDWVQLWPQAPLLGHGAGSWPLLTGRPDERASPHNMFLEVLVETGLVGFVFLVALFATALRPLSLERLRRDPDALCVVMMVVSMLFHSMVSGDLTDHRVLFLLMGLLVLLAVRPAVAVAPAEQPPTVQGGRLREAAILPGSIERRREQVGVGVSSGNQ